MDPVLNGLTEWLENRMNQKILIQKNEQGDVDQTELILERVGYRKAGERPIDEYVDGSAIMLHGHGSIITGNDRYPLPQDLYVIPVKGLGTVSVSGQTELTFQTERAQYTLHI